MPILILIKFLNLNLTLLQNKQLIHEILKELLKEQTKTPGGWKDDVDLRVEEIEAKEGRRVCPVCQTVMERSRRKWRASFV